jgi:hypothetical protein
VPEFDFIFGHPFFASAYTCNCEHKIIAEHVGHKRQAVTLFNIQDGACFHRLHGKTSVITWTATPGGAVPTDSPAKSGRWATPEAAAQIKREAGLDGFGAKSERENDGKNGETH